MKHHRVRRHLVSHDSALYPAARWLYQPVKAARARLGEWRAKAAAHGTISNYLARPGFKGLHVGCGPFHLPGWLNSEMYGYHSRADFVQDLTRRFPIRDEKLDAVYACEVIEHIQSAGVKNFLREIVPCS